MLSFAIALNGLLVATGGCSAWNIVTPTSVVTAPGMKRH
jgi:hypothetical protein